MRRLAHLVGGVVLAHLAALAGLAEVPAGDPAAGRVLAGQCRTCHGLDGMARIPIAPHIGGEPAGYLSRQLAAFRSGAREHEMMSVVAKGLTDEAIGNLAAWYAAQVPTAGLPAGRTEADAPEACTACHGADGMATMEDAPNLAGENVMYIDTQLKAFRSGKRVHDIMTGIAADLSDDDIRALAAWYAGTTLTLAPPSP
ncbi:MAG: c-type cytochrome [Paracoccaceae bacterium]|nr:MAG: c-type cytochrome [Paracoccaceae bacterium]